MTALPHQFEELADLVWALVNDRLDATGTSRLRQLLDDRAANRRIYIELMDQFASLEWERAEGKRSQEKKFVSEGGALQCPVQCPIENQNRSACFSVHPITTL